MWAVCYYVATLKVMLRFQFDGIISEDGLVRYKTDGVYCDNSVFLFESVLQCKEITNNILMFFMLLLELRNECCTRKCLPWKSLKCFVNLICINFYSFLTTKKAFEVIYNDDDDDNNNNNNNNNSLGSWYSACTTEDSLFYFRQG